MSSKYLIYTDGTIIYKLTRIVWNINALRQASYEWNITFSGINGYEYAYLILHTYRGDIEINVARVDSSWNIVTYNSVYGITVTPSNNTLNLKAFNAAPFFFLLEQISGSYVSVNISEVS